MSLVDDAHVDCRKAKTRKFRDKTGKRYGSLTVTKHIGFSGRISVWECQCDCGRSVRVLAVRLTASYQKKHQKQSCGVGCPLWATRTHGLTGSRIYAVHSSHLNSGTLSPEWLSVVAFYEAFKDLQDDEFIARPNRSKPLGPSNFEITLSRSHGIERLVEIDGTTLNLTQWADLLGITRERARQLQEAGRLADRVRKVGLP